MTDAEKRPTDLPQSTDELRRLIAENPTLPLLVFASEDAVCGDYTYTCCSSVSASLGEFLDCQQEVNEERVYCDKDDFAEEYADKLYDWEGRDWDGSDKEWDEYVDKRIAEYDPYWKPCIILYVGN